MVTPLAFVADGGLIVLELTIPSDPIGHRPPGCRRIIKRLLRGLLTAHRRRQILVQNVPILKRAGNPEIGQHGVGVEGVAISLGVGLDIRRIPASTNILIDRGRAALAFQELVGIAWIDTGPAMLRVPKGHVLHRH